jgi:hypothetical protein
MPEKNSNPSNPNPPSNRPSDRDLKPGQSAHEPTDDVTQAVEAGDPRITGRQSGQPGEGTKPRQPEAAD